MKITQLGAPGIVMQNPCSHHNYFGWPTVTRLQNGRLAVVASGNRMKHICPFGKTVISYSDDDGKTYTLPAPVIDTPLDDRDGGIVTFGESGVIVTSFNNTRSAQRSWAKDDDTKPYFFAYLDSVTDVEEEKYLGSTFRVSFDCGVTFGPIYKSPVTSPHGPCELKDGTILWVGRTFSKNDAKMADDCIAAYRINPYDGTAEYMGRIDNVYNENGASPLSCEPHVYQREDGTLICHIRVEGSKDFAGFTTYQSVSTDLGKTWTAPEPLIGPRGGAPAHIIRHSSGVLISVYGYRTSPFGVKAMFSYDDGRTWDVGHDIYVNGVSADLGYPSTVEMADGSLLTVFYAHPTADSPAIILQQRWRFEN